MKRAAAPLLGLFSIAMAVTGCQTTGAAYEPDAETAALIATHQGEEVNRICFGRNIDGWRELDRRSILVSSGVNRWHRLELIGSCNPDRAFFTIAIEQRPAGGCLTPGDRITTDDRAFGGSCLITHIYEWDEDAEAPEPGEEETEN